MGYTDPVVIFKCGDDTLYTALYITMVLAVAATAEPGDPSPNEVAMLLALSSSAMVEHSADARLPDRHGQPRPVPRFWAGAASSRLRGNWAEALGQPVI